MAAGGLVWRAYDQGVFSAGAGAAYEPWTSWRSDAAPGPLGLVRAGILAANPHNTQPWLFQVGAARIELFADTRATSAPSIPYLREMHIGLGCALENMTRTARVLGYDVALTLHPGPLAAAAASPRPQPVATLALSPARPRPDQLVEAIPRRHTDRGAYAAGRPCRARCWRRCGPPSRTTRTCASSSSRRRGSAGSSATLVQASTETIIADPAMVAASDRWFRHRWARRAAAARRAHAGRGRAAPLVTVMGKLMPPPSPETSHRYWRDATRDVQIPTSALFGLIAVRDLYDRPQALRAGQRWQRLHLMATRGARDAADQPAGGDGGPGARARKGATRGRRAGRADRRGRVEADLRVPRRGFPRGRPRRARGVRWTRWWCPSRRAVCSEAGPRRGAWPAGPAGRRR